MPKDRNSMGAVTRRGANAGGRMATFSRWRRERPFWGAALAIVAGLEIYSAAAAPISVMAMQGLPGLLTLCVALVAVIMGAVTLFQPVQRVITGWVVLVLGPISILATNLGGFVIGMIMLVVGGALILSWQPPATDATAEAAAAVTSPLVADPYTPPVERDAYSDSDGANSDAYSDDAESEAAADQTVEVAPVVGESGYGTPAPVSSEPVSEPAEPEQTRNPWRSRTPSAIREDTSDVAATPATAPVTSSQPAPSTTPETAGTPEAPNAPNASASPAPVPVAEGEAPASTRSWFAGSSQLPSMEPPKNLVRTTLLIPLILVSIAASGLLVTPSAQAETADLPCLIPILCPATTPAPEPSATPSTAPSATPSAGVTLPTLPNLLPGDPKDTGGAAKTPDLATAADCPTAAKAPEGTTSGGQAAIDGAAAVQACQKAGETATVSAAAVGDAPQVSNVLSTMKASRLEMEGFKYNGIETLQSRNGPIKALSFTLDTLKVTGMDQTYKGPGYTVGITNPKGVVTISGDVHLYVTSMTGKIFGLLELTFTPDFAPPLVLPSMFFTDTTSSVVLVQANKITLPDLVHPAS